MANPACRIVISCVIGQSGGCPQSLRLLVGLPPIDSLLDLPNRHVEDRRPAAIDRHAHPTVRVNAVIWYNDPSSHHNNPRTKDWVNQSGNYSPLTHHCLCTSHLGTPQAGAPSGPSPSPTAPHTPTTPRRAAVDAVDHAYFAAPSRHTHDSDVGRKVISTSSLHSARLPPATTMIHKNQTGHNRRPWCDMCLWPHRVRCQTPRRPKLWRPARRRHRRPCLHSESAPLQWWTDTPLTVVIAAPMGWLGRLVVGGKPVLCVWHRFSTDTPCSRGRCRGPRHT